MFLTNDSGEILSFSSFCLSESISPNKTDFGTNDSMDDGKFKVIKDFFIYAFFEHNGNYYTVYMNSNDGEVGFGVSKTYSLNPTDYSDDRVQTRNALRVLGKVLYVLFELVTQFSIDVIRFNAANPALGKVYDRMVSNKFVLSYIEKFGYEYDSKYGDSHFFVRNISMLNEQETPDWEELAKLRSITARTFAAERWYDQLKIMYMYNDIVRNPKADNSDIVSTFLQVMDGNAYTKLMFMTWIEGFTERDDSPITYKEVLQFISYLWMCEERHIERLKREGVSQ